MPPPDAYDAIHCGDDDQVQSAVRLGDAAQHPLRIITTENASAIVAERM